MAKPLVATAPFTGCFGCHMSLLDIDERILDLVELVEFHKSPINDIKTFTRPVDVGLLEGGISNDENYEQLKQFRKHCKILISVGQCAI
ncbi:MAG TPA: NADP oxidoreductase, partial [Candidatus Hydrogenedentes bacterium]|nr:NADP oxidoreductase [Candidatus Hydrogenedentota bacterium]